jgi:hypothetical protein
MTMIRRGFAIVAALVLAGAAVEVGPPLQAQGRGRGAQPPATARAAAPFDPTGYWVAVVTEDWRWRMVTPAKGDYQSIPINAAAQKVADTWDPAKDDAAGEQCKGYGTPGLMRAPTRLNISWLDDNTLKVESDYGIQTRLLRFGGQKPASGAPSWQGESSAMWEGGARGRGEGGGTGTLVIKTSNLRPGYLRKNGVPYSASTTMTEYWDLIVEPSGEQRLLMLLIVNDPVYLQQPWTVPVHFKKEPNGSKWDPTPCNAKF